MIGSKFNFEDIFLRDLTVGVLYTLEDKIKWRNRFSSGDVFVKVPIYYSLSGDERFLLDSFSDDIVSENRYVELNTDTIPRGHLTLTGFNIKSDEFANPNVWLKMVVENEWEIRKVLTQVRAIPITVNYDLEILVSSEIEGFTQFRHHTISSIYSDFPRTNKYMSAIISKIYLQEVISNVFSHINTSCLNVSIFITRYTLPIGATPEFCSK